MKSSPHRKISAWQIGLIAILVCAGSLVAWIFSDLNAGEKPGARTSSRSPGSSTKSTARLPTSKLAAAKPNDDRDRPGAVDATSKIRGLAPFSPILPDDQAKAVEAEDSNEARKSLKRDLTTSEQPPDDLRSASDRMSQDINKALLALRKAILQSELRRCQFETKEFPEAAYARVVISAPSPGETQEFQSRLETSALSMADYLRESYLVEGQRLIDRYLHFVSPYIVLMTVIPTQGRMVYNKEADAYEMLSEFGSYAVFSTTNPQNYQISDAPLPNGTRFRVPDSVQATLKTRPWFSGNSQPARFRHLFQGLTPESVEL